MYIQYENLDYQTKSSFAAFLSLNYDEIVKELGDKTLLNALKQYDKETYDKLHELSYQYQNYENVLTLLIYLLDKKSGIKVSTQTFYKPKDITNEMKICYPRKSKELTILFSDSILADIYQLKYQDTLEQTYKRYYNFFKNIYEHNNYGFVYYYYLFFHLEEDEKVRFTFDNRKMYSVDDISKYLLDNSFKINNLLEEIANNEFILALVAKEMTLDAVCKALDKKDNYSLLSLFSLRGKYDFENILRNNMAFYLIDHYENYDYNTKEAKKLFKRYNSLNFSYHTNQIDYIDTFNLSKELYHKFIELYEFNDIMFFHKGISPKDLQDKLRYKENDFFVSERYLKDNNHYDIRIHTEMYQKSVAKEIVTDKIDAALKDNEKLILKCEKLKEEREYNKKDLVYKIILAILFMAVAGVSLYIGLNNLLEISLAEYYLYVCYGFAGLSLINFFIILIKLIQVNQLLGFSKKREKENDYYLSIRDSIINEELIDKDKKTILKLQHYSQRNEKKYNRIEKRHHYVSKDYLLMLLSFVSLFYLLSYLPMFITHNLLGIQMFGYATKINFALLVGGAAYLIIMIIFRHRKIIYFIPYLLLIGLILISYFQ